MAEIRYEAGPMDVLAEAVRAGIELGTEDLFRDPDTGVLNIDGMPWFEWLEAMTDG